MDPNSDDGVGNRYYDDNPDFEQRPVGPVDRTLLGLAWGTQILGFLTWPLLFLFLALGYWAGFAWRGLVDGFQLGFARKMLLQSANDTIRAHRQSKRQALKEAS